MNNRESLQKQIIEFLKNDNERIMLITGTHQYEKHKEVLRVVNKNVQDGIKILIRINAKNNIDSILGNKFRTVELNKRIKLGNLRLYIDTINKRTWKNEKHNVSIIYPIDSLCRMKAEQKREIITNIVTHSVNKIFIVSWTDMYDYEWLNEFGIDRVAIFDAKEEDEAYHNRVIEHINNYK